MARLEELEADPIGRARELDLLDGFIKAARGGERRAFMLLGPAGIGKTTLLRWCVRRCREEAMAVAAVRVPVGAGLPPRYPIGEVLTALKRSCDRLRIPTPTPLARAESALQRLDLGEPFPMSINEVAEALGEIAAKVPIAILIDDCHAALEEGPKGLEAALRVVAFPLLLGGGARTHASDASKRTTWFEPDSDLWVDYVRLEGLDSSAVGSLLSERLGGEVLPSLIESVHALTLGNPLLVMEMARSWSSGNMLERAGGYLGTCQPGEPGLPTSITELVATSIASLKPPERLLASALALLGRDASFELLQAISRLNTDQLVIVLEALEFAGIVVPLKGKENVYRIAQPIYEQAIIDSLAGARRGELHTRVFNALVATSGNNSDPVRAIELANHAVRSLPRPPELEKLLRSAAAEADSVGNYEEAARWYSLLAGAAGSDRSLEILALRRQGEAAVNITPQTAEQVLSRALSLSGNELDMTALLIARARTRRRVGDLSGAFTDLCDAEQRASGGDRLEIWSVKATLHGILGELDAAERLLSRVLNHTRTGSLASTAHCNLSVLAGERGDLDAAIEHACAARRLADTPADRGSAAINEGWFRALAGQWEAAISIFTRAIDTALSVGDIWNAISLKTNLSNIRAWQGCFPEAYDLCLSARHDAAMTGRIMDRVDVLDALATVHLEAGTAADALQAASAAVQLIGLDIETYDQVVVFSNLAEAYRRLRAIDEALRCIEEIEERAIAHPLWNIRLDRIHAAILFDTGRTQEARDRLTRALEEPTAVNPFERAQALELLAKIELTAGNAGLARRYANMALNQYSLLGSSHSAARCERVIRRRGRPLTSRTLSLTPREIEVAVLVARGLTDAAIGTRLFVSSRTVSKHVSNILKKISAERRSQIATFVLRERLESAAQHLLPLL